MSEVINLKKVRTEKITKKKIDDINSIIHIINMSVKAFGFFDQKKVVMQIISSLVNYRTILEIIRNRYIRSLDGDK